MLRAPWSTRTVWENLAGMFMARESVRGSWKVYGTLREIHLREILIMKTIKKKKFKNLRQRKNYQNVGKK